MQCVSCDEMLGCFETPATGAGYPRGAHGIDVQVATSPGLTFGPLGRGCN